MKRVKSGRESIMILFLVAALLSGCAGKNLRQEEDQMAVVPTSIGNLPANIGEDQDGDGTDAGETVVGGAEPQSGEHAALEQLGTYLEYLLRRGTGIRWRQSMPKRS